MCCLLPGNTHLTSKEPLHGLHNERISLYASENARGTVFHILQKTGICECVCHKISCKKCIRIPRDLSLRKSSGNLNSSCKWISFVLVLLLLSIGKDL